MADIANGTQFSDLPSCLVIEILVRVPVKALLICRYVRKDWTCLYFSDPYFIRRQLETSNTQFLNQELTTEGKFRFGWFVDEVSTGNLKMETLDLSCNLPEYDPENEDEWFVVNSCNGLICLREDIIDSASVYVCNPILGECVCIPVPNGCFCVLGFSAKNNQYKILSCVEIGDMYPKEFEWEICTLGTGQWRSIETKENIKLWYGYGLDFNTCIHGSLHWTDYSEKEGEFVVSFDFETERFTVFPLPKLQNPNIELELQYQYSVALGVINGCLWASFYNPLHYNYEELGYFDNDTSYQNITHYHDGETWAMKENGVWTMMIAMRNNHMNVYDTPDEVLLARNNELGIHEQSLSQSLTRHKLLFSLNEDEMLILDDSSDEVIGYNIKTKRGWEMMVPELSLRDVTAYNPSFVSLHDVGRGEERKLLGVRDFYDRLIKKRPKKKTKEKLKKKKLKRV